MPRCSAAGRDRSTASARTRSARDDVADRPPRRARCGSARAGRRSCGPRGAPRRPSARRGGCTTSGSSSATSVSASRASAPTGVFSSWLMLATKSRRTASRRRRSVMSSTIATAPRAGPAPTACDLDDARAGARTARAPAGSRALPAASGEVALQRLLDEHVAGAGAGQPARHRVAVHLVTVGVGEHDADARARRARRAAARRPSAGVRRDHGGGSALASGAAGRARRRTDRHAAPQRAERWRRAAGQGRSPPGHASVGSVDGVRTPERRGASSVGLIADGERDGAPAPV